MAVIHRTTLVPSKLELLTAWLPTRPWYTTTGRGPELSKAGGFRLDDPDGEVGIEFMVTCDASGDRPRTYHVPLTYRDAPLDGGEEALLGVSEHGVLGPRWIYDGTRDSVLVAQVLALLRGEAEPQAQSISGTPDPSVSASCERADIGAAIRSMTATDDPHGTVLVVDTTNGDARGAGSRVSLRVVRQVDAGESAGDHIGGVAAGWRLPDGSEHRGAYLVVDGVTSDFEV